jgi:DNA modification methylase
MIRVERIGEATMLGGKVQLLPGDCREVMGTLPDASVDAIVCDPPYALTEVPHVSSTGKFGGKRPPDRKAARRGFMGKTWDTGEAAFSAEFWQQALRVLKPGGHLVAFSGTRTYHRMACAIEDAGFEIRDSLYWHYGSGFPKSANVGKQLDANGARCVCGKDVHHMRDDVDADNALSGSAQSDMRPGVHESPDRESGNGSAIAAQSARDRGVRGLREGKDDPASMAAKGQAADVLAAVQRGSAGAGIDISCTQGAQRLDSRKHGLLPQKDDGRGQPVVEGRRHVSARQGQLQGGEVGSVPAGFAVNGNGERVRDGASASDGTVGRAPADAAGVRAPSGPRPAEQRPEQSGTLAVQPDAQARGAWPSCGRCCKPIVPDGLGTALKPATEPICLARKPLIGTVAANVLAHGTGALNIDGCRVGTELRTATATVPKYRNSDRGEGSLTNDGRDAATWEKYKTETGAEVKTYEGRWPANLLHDGSEEVVALFPETGASSDHVRHNTPEGVNKEHTFGRSQEAWTTRGPSDSGSAARFFYTSKADAEDRLGSTHPTVKPVDLMQWLCRLVCPKGGTVLDPFAGTGTTGEAAWREGMRAILIEREPEYQADIARRMDLATQPTKRAAVAATKNKLDDPNTLPLFAGAAE